MDNEELSGRADVESAEAGEEAGGIVHCGPGVADTLGEFADLMECKAPVREAARFAMAIGIQTGDRARRTEWGKGKPRNIAHLRGQFDEAGRYDYALLFEMLGLADETVPLNVLISEYITGGLRWVMRNELASGTNFSQLRRAFPDLFEMGNQEGSARS